MTLAKLDDLLINITGRVNISRRGFQIPLFGFLLLLLYVLMPVVGFIFDPVMNWFSFRVPDRGSMNNLDYICALAFSELSVTILVVVAFICMCLHYLVLTFISRSEFVLKDSTESSAEKSSLDRFQAAILSQENRAKKYSRNQFWISLVLSFTLYALVVLVNHYTGLEDVPFNWLGMLIYLLVTLVGVIAFNSPETVVRYIFTGLDKLYLTTRRLMVWLPEAIVNTFNKFRRKGRESATPLSSFAGSYNKSLFSFEKSDRLSGWSNRGAAILIACLSVPLLLVTSPETEVHGQFPVFFFFTLFLSVVVSLWFFRTFWWSVINGLIEKIFSVFSVFSFTPSGVLICVVCAVALILGIKLALGKFEETSVTKKEVTTEVSKKSDKMNKPTEDTVVVVAIEGGGIAASGWGYAVLDHLKQNYNSQIYRNIVAVSTVSGGTLGTYYHLTEVESIDRKIKRQNKRAGLALRSSLGAVAWGAARYDSWKVPLSVFPFFSRDIGREDSLITRWSSLHCEKKISPPGCEIQKKNMKKTFSQWRTNRPYFLINSTSRSDGSRVVFSTDPEFSLSHVADVESDGKSATTPPEQPNLKTSTALDIPEIYSKSNCVSNYAVIKAVYNSATFPYVGRSKSPDVDADAPDHCQNFAKKNLLDGGYYDNTGVQTAADYISHLQNINVIGKKTRLVLLSVSAYPEKLSKSDNLGNSQQHTNGISSSLVGIVEPIIGLMKARKIQKSVKRDTVAKLEKQYPGMFYRELNFTGSEELTLSWHLSEKEKDNILNAISNTSDSDGNGKQNVDEILSGLVEELAKRGDAQPKPADTNPTTIKTLRDRITFLEKDYKEKNEGFEAILKQQQKEIATASQSVSVLSGEIDHQEEKIRRVRVDLSGLSNKIAMIDTTRSKARDWRSAVTAGVCDQSMEPKVVTYSSTFASSKPDDSGNWASGFWQSDIWDNDVQPVCGRNCQVQRISNDILAMSEYIGSETLVHVVGSASVSGSGAENRKLSKRRADWLRDAIFLSSVNSQGIAYENIRSYPVGEVEFTDSIDSSVFTADKNANSRRAFAFVCI